MSEEPRRWLDDPSLDETLRAALEAGRAEAPSEAELASLAGRLGPLLGGPGGGGGGGDGGGGVDPSPLLGGSVATKAIGALAVAAAIAGASAWIATRAGPPPPSPQASRVAPPEVEPPALLRELPVGVDVPEELAEPAPAPPIAPRPRARAPALEVDPAAELALIQRAQDTLRSSSREALALTEEHRRRFGDGTLGQEREVVAIDALARLGRHDEARARAARFHARWPRSAHGRRVDVIVAE